MVTKVYSRTFQKAAELCGGQKKLARQLRVPLADLERWIAGGETPPTNVFLRAIDLVLDETPSPAAGSDPDDSAPPRDCATVSDVAKTE
jgi:hypothetical protein